MVFRLFLLSIALASGCAADDTSGGPPANKQITAFAFEVAHNAGLTADVPCAISGTAITGSVPLGTDVTALVATFSITGAEITVAGVAQVSGSTANDFSAPVTYHVRAEDGSSVDYTVTVTSGTSSAKELTTFRFDAASNAALSAEVVATIVGTSIDATVPDGTDVTALVATFATTGVAVRVGGVEQVSGTTANDFTNTVTYTVVAEDTSTQDYTVTVSSTSGAKELTEFRFVAARNFALDVDVTGAINGTQIDATVPAGTDVTALVATFATTGVAVRVGGVEQVSGTTTNDFTNAVDYVVEAANSSTRTYTVTVTEASSGVCFGDYTVRNATDMAVIVDCTEITGYLHITSSDLTNLDGPSQLATVGSHLLINYNAALTDVSGLGALTTVGDFVRIFDNDALTQVDGLALTTVGGALEILGNDLLDNLDGLDSLTSVGDYLEINNNAALASIAGLSSLSTIPGSLLIDSNPLLGSLAGLEQVTTLGIGTYDVGLEINDNGNLIDLTGLDNLSTVTGRVEIIHNEQLASLDGLGALATVGEGISICDNDVLATLEHLTDVTSLPTLLVGDHSRGGNPVLDSINVPNLESVGNLFIESNAELDDLAGLVKLATVEDLHINQNPTMTTLGFGSGAATPPVVTHSIEVFRNNALEDLDGIDATETLTGYVRVIDNDALSTLAALDNLTSVDGYITIGLIDFGGQPSLTAIGLPSLESIGGELRIEDNDNVLLVDLGFGSLQTVGGSITVSGNANILSLGGLDDLTVVNGTLEIEANPSLTDLAALGDVTSVSGNLVIENNVSLETLLGLDLVGDVGGVLRIAYNNELVDLDGLGGLNTIGGHLEIERNYNLGDLDGLAGLTTIPGHLTVDTNSVLDNTDGLANIETVDGYVRISSNGLTHLDLSSLQAVPADLRIQNNTLLSIIDMGLVASVSSDLILDNINSLTSIDFGSLSHVGRHIYVRNIGGLTNIDFLSGVTSGGSLGGDLALTNDPNLSDISALATVTTIGGYLDITNDASLGSVDALASLETIGGSLWIRNMPLVSNLSGLASVTSIGGLLMIQQNGSLSALGLDLLASLTYDLYVENNSSLCNDLATALQSQLEGAGWSRTAHITGNTGTCD